MINDNVQHQLDAGNKVFTIPINKSKILPLDGGYWIYALDVKENRPMWDRQLRYVDPVALSNPTYAFVKEDYLLSFGVGMVCPEFKYMFDLRQAFAQIDIRRYTEYQQDKQLILGEVLAHLFCDM